LFDRAIAQHVRALLELGEPEVYQQVCSAVDRVAFQEAIRHACRTVFKHTGPNSPAGLPP
jgi:hypothetical protein